MEKNCLVTKYKATVNDNSLLKIGEMRLEVGVHENSKGYILDYTNYPVVIETLDGSNSLTTDKTLLTGFTNKLELTQDYMQFYINNQNVVISAPNKYDIRGINCGNTTINLGDLEHSPNLVYLGNVNCKGSLESLKSTSIRNIMGVNIEEVKDLSSFIDFPELTQLGITEISGDISSISGLTNLSIVNFMSTQISGDISSINGLANLSNINLGRTSVSGDISSISGLTNLYNLELNDTRVSRVISSISGLTKLRNLNLGRTSISGNISSLGTLTALTTMELQGLTNLRGEIIDYVIAQRSNGRTSGKTWFGPSNTVTFNGVAYNRGNTISWTASTITNETTSETVNR